MPSGCCATASPRWTGGCRSTRAAALISKGHPIGATGAAQLVELADQMRGRSGTRQREGARFGLAENAGGWIGADAAAACVTILGSTRH